MWIKDVGDGDPNFAIVACLHGDETCGLYAIYQFLWQGFDIKKPIRLIVANPEAVAKKQRSVNEDLNRSFPGDQNSESHEQRRAQELLNQLNGMKVLDLHSTVSLSGSDSPFGLLQRFNQETKRLARSTGLKRFVDIREVGGGFISYVDGVAVECGPKGTDIANANAYRILKNFLSTNGVIKGEGTWSSPELYTVYAKVLKQSHQFVGSNFEQIKAGEVFAINNDAIRAEEEFYPVLMSTEGYEDILGFKARFDGYIHS